MNDVLIIDPPIHSVFITPNTPGSKIPSHGTAKYGEMYAIDFVVVNQSGLSKKPYKPSFMTYLLKGIQLCDFYGWGEKVYAPVAGVVVNVIDGMDERNPVNIFKDIRYMMHVTKAYEKEELDYSRITGNCVIIQYGTSKYCLLAHLKKGSIIVKEGQNIAKNELLGELGHSGNSTMPHLHMQFMDHIDFKNAHGIPFKFREYAIYKRGEWVMKMNAIPKKEDIIKVE